tara:strand:+ start:1249 stop:1470 length:222 start_codon:yes stop_codon:yes gene_type:complete
MRLLIKKLFLTFTFNFSLFLFLIIAIQNSSQKRQVNLIINETVKLPISFIAGISFISGSITASLITINSRDRN